MKKYENERPAPVSWVKKPASMIMVIAVLLLVAACGRMATHPTLTAAQLPDLIPLRDFFATRFSYGYALSPDGAKMGWLHPTITGRSTLHFKTIGEDKVATLTAETPVRNFTWAQDSRRVLIYRDMAGDENWRIFLADSAQPERSPQDLTPFANTRSHIHQMLRSDPEHILITHNQRDKSAFDLYRLNLTTGEQVRIAENPGDVSTWITGRDGALLARLRPSAGGGQTLEVRRGEPERWEPALTWGLEETVGILGYPPDIETLWALSNRGRDRLSLVRLDLKTGEEELIYVDPRVDLTGAAIDPETYELVAAWSWPDYRKIHFFDKTFEADYALFDQAVPANIGISSDSAKRLAIVTVSAERTGTDYYLLDRRTQTKNLLAANPIAKHRDRLSTTTPIAFKSRDGLTIHGYLTIPQGTAGKNLPLVLMVHGGPFDQRDAWGYSPFIQFLANRGYAVLRVNFRGSGGYGRAFREAAIREFAGKMHDDLIDAVRWTIAAGIADPERIAIFGASYGGYATLVGLTFTPDVFAAGISIVGPSDLVALLEDFPPYFKHGLPWWHKYVGNPNDPADRREMQARSPLSRVDQVKRPLLVVQGAKDVRVLKGQSDQLVAALREAGKEVEYIVFPDEGHGIGRWQNFIKFSRALEDFLARHLGGRTGGFHWIELIP